MVKKKKKSVPEKPAGLYANIHAAQKRAARGGRAVRANGEKGAPTSKAFQKSAGSAKKKRKKSTTKK